MIGSASGSLCPASPRAAQNLREGWSRAAWYFRWGKIVLTPRCASQARWAVGFKIDSIRPIRCTIYNWHANCSQRWISCRVLVEFGLAVRIEGVLTALIRIDVLHRLRIFLQAWVSGLGRPVRWLADVPCL